eukprot:1435961-Pyramimonas_sp.AAC.1
MIPFSEAQFRWRYGRRHVRYGSQCEHNGPRCGCYGNQCGRYGHHLEEVGALREHPLSTRALVGVVRQQLFQQRQRAGGSVRQHLMAARPRTPLPSAQSPYCHR